jgi:tRNA (cytidine/uridine-2'-O-)-methyltransferase
MKLRARLPTVVLVSPRDPGNVGSIGRTVVGLGSELHVIGPIGFDFSDHAAQRAQLDYWHMLKWRKFRSWADYVEEMGLDRLRKRGSFFTAHGAVELGHADAWPSREEANNDSAEALLVFGSETSGFRGLIPDEQLETFRRVKIPMANAEMRCYNLAVSVGIALWEAARIGHE